MNNKVTISIGGHEYQGVTLKRDNKEIDSYQRLEFTISFDILNSEWNPPYNLEKIVLVKDETIKMITEPTPEIKSQLEAMFIQMGSSGYKILPPDTDLLGGEEK